MPEGSYLYCDVSLPVPLDQPFTYSLPDTLRHRVRVGSRLIVPFGTRKLTGVILRCHDDPPGVATRDALRLIDSEPVLRCGTDGAGPVDLRGITARRWAMCCAACCPSPRRSAAGKSGR